MGNFRIKILSIINSPFCDAVQVLKYNEFMDVEHHALRRGGAASGAARGWHFQLKNSKL
jgi:hypothetical protein